jgi:predicted transposase YdaD
MTEALNNNALTNPEKQDHDSPWKEALELRFPEFLELLFTNIYLLVDWHQPIAFLDKELQQILPNAENGRTYADKLVQVSFKDGQSRWVLIHVEVQDEPEAEFAQRMFQYNYRIRDKYQQEVISLAVLSDSNPKFIPNRYEFSLAGCRILFEFPMVKLLDWKDRLDELHQSENVFALIVAAQLQVKLNKQPEQRLDAKVKLIRLLYERGYSKEQVIELLRLIDWMIRLPDNLEIKFKDIVDQIEEERHMAYVTSIERLALQQGIHEGALRGKLDGKLEGKLEAGLLMIREFNLSVNEVADKLNIPLTDLVEFINQHDQPKS